MSDENSITGGEHLQIDWVTEAGPSFSWSPSHHLHFAPCGIQIDMRTGEVTIPEGLDLSEASRAFWDAVQRMTGQRCGFD